MQMRIFKIYQSETMLQISNKIWQKNVAFENFICLRRIKFKNFGDPHAWKFLEFRILILCTIFIKIVISFMTYFQ